MPKKRGTHHGKGKGRARAVEKTSAKTEIPPDPLPQNTGNKVRETTASTQKAIPCGSGDNQRVRRVEDRGAHAIAMPTEQEMLVRGKGIGRAVEKTSAKIEVQTDPLPENTGNKVRETTVYYSPAKKVIPGGSGGKQRVRRAEDRGIHAIAMPKEQEMQVRGKGKGKGRVLEKSSVKTETQPDPLPQNNWNKVRETTVYYSTVKKAIPGGTGGKQTMRRAEDGGVYATAMSKQPGMQVRGESRGTGQTVRESKVNTEKQPVLIPSSCAPPIKVDCTALMKATPSCSSGSQVVRRAEDIAALAIGKGRGRAIIRRGEVQEIQGRGRGRGAGVNIEKKVGVTMNKSQDHVQSNPVQPSAENTRNSPQNFWGKLSQALAECADEEFGQTTGE